MRTRRQQRGFTLLEVMVATVIMAIAISGLMFGVRGSLRNAARLQYHDRAALLARQKMDELIVDVTTPRGRQIQGIFDPVAAPGMNATWTATIEAFDFPDGAGPGMPILDRIDLLIAWNEGSERRTFRLEGYRRGTLVQGDGLPHR